MKPFFCLTFFLLALISCRKEKVNFPQNGISVNELIEIAFFPYFITDLENGDSVFGYMYDSFEGVFYDGISDTFTEENRQNLKVVLFYISNDVVVENVKLKNQVSEKMFGQEVKSFFVESP